MCVVTSLTTLSPPAGFDGRKFVFKPPSLPRQLALSDVRKAGFVASRVQASIHTQEEERQKVEEGDQAEGRVANTMTVSVAVKGREPVVKSAGGSGHGQLEVDPFDVLRPLQWRT